MQPGFGLGEINQQGYVVSSIEDAAMHYVSLVGAGPFYIGEFTLDDYRFRGDERRCRLRIGTGYWGAMMLEFIQPLDAEGTLYPLSLPHRDGHLQHVGINVADLDGWLAEREVEDRIVQRGAMRASGVRFVYLENMFPGGVHLEVIEGPPAMLDSLAAISRASARWDGVDPLRPMSALASDMAAEG